MKISKNLLVVFFAFFFSNSTFAEVLETKIAYSYGKDQISTCQNIKKKLQSYPIASECLCEKIDESTDNPYICGLHYGLDRKKLTCMVDKELSGEQKVTEYKNVSYVYSIGKNGFLEKYNNRGETLGLSREYTLDPVVMKFRTRTINNVYDFDASINLKNGIFTIFNDYGKVYVKGQCSKSELADVLKFLKK